MAARKTIHVGYTNFALGLPGNLIPVARKDYADHRLRFGGGTKADGSDGFQIYENGGATACFAYYTLAALYDLGRIHDGDRILFPMLDAFAKRDFQGFGSNGMSRDWKTWDGQCHGYEGFLNDNYYALLAVLDREAALKKSTGLTNDRAGGHREVAFWNGPGVQVEVSSHSFRVGAMTRPGSVCPLNKDGCHLEPWFPPKGGPSS